jgi:hypothetical protein
MAAMAELSLTLDRMGKCFKTLHFTETTWTIETKIFRNVHLMGLYKFSFFLCRLEIQASHHLKS